VLLEKICKGLQELYRLPVENEMLDNALSVQAQRFKGLSEFFDARQDYKEWPEQKALSQMMLDLSNGIESYRMDYLTTGNKQPILDFVQTALTAKSMVEALWRKEDGGG
jgi:spore cortex formation protein SpoVR/YcgB (stage V sporulation)